MRQNTAKTDEINYFYGSTLKHAFALSHVRVPFNLKNEKSNNENGTKRIKKKKEAGGATTTANYTFFFFLSRLFSHIANGLLLSNRSPCRNVPTN